MKIDRAEIFQVKLELVHPFRTSFGVMEARELILICLQSEGLQGWGEAPVTERPGYSYETVETVWHVLNDFFLPAVLGQELKAPTDLPRLLSHFKGHPMARASLELALWDIFGKADRTSLRHILGGSKEKVPVGVSIGIQDSNQALLERVAAFVEMGYQRIKIKIEPGRDLDLVQAVRGEFPNVPLQVDANAAYTPEDSELLRELDGFELTMIEQPFAADDLIEHSKLQAMLSTAICLDESIGSFRQAKGALELKAAQIINIKQARVGGLSEALLIHDLCQQLAIPVWCGGLLETGVGRAANLALASLPGFSLPGDISATDRYYQRDLASPSFQQEEGYIQVPDGPGLGVEIDKEFLEACTLRSQVVF